MEQKQKRQERKGRKEAKPEKITDLAIRLVEAVLDFVYLAFPPIISTISPLSFSL